MNKVSICFNILYNYKCYRTSTKKHLLVEKDLHDRIIGLLLGDSSAERPHIKCNTRLQFKQSSINKEYINYLYLLFAKYCGSVPLNMSKYDSRINKNKTYNAIKFQTLSLPCFNPYKQLFYNSEGKKILPKNIGELLTDKGLAHWFMDDGYKSVKGLYFCSESFSLDENNILMNVIKTNFNIQCSVHKVSNGYRIYIFSSSVKKFIELVKPHMINHFNYKLSIRK